MVKHEVYTKETESIKKMRKDILGNKKLPSLIKEQTVKYFLVLSLDEIDLGYIEMSKIDPETYEVTSIAVKEQYRHQKVGTYLIKYGQVKLKTVGGRKMRGLIPPELIPFFRKNEFRFIDDEAILIDGMPYALMQKSFY